MVTITFDEKDLMQLKVIIMDHDVDEAYSFLSNRIMPEANRQEGMKMRSHLEGGKGSAL